MCLGSLRHVNSAVISGVFGLNVVKFSLISVVLEEYLLGDG